MPHVEILTWQQAAALRENADAATTVEELRLVITQLIELLGEDKPVQEPDA